MLDLLITDINTQPIIKIIQDPIISDHLIIVASIDQYTFFSPNCQTLSNYYWCLKNLTDNEENVINSEILNFASTDLQKFSKLGNLDSLINMINAKIEEIFKKCRVMHRNQTIHRLNLPPWISGRTSYLIKLKNTIERKPNFGISLNLNTKHTNILKEIKISISDDMSEYLIKLNTDHNMNKLYSFLRIFSKQDQACDLFYEGKSLSEDKDKAESFNLFFNSVYAVTHTDNTFIESKLNTFLRNSSNVIPKFKITVDQIIKIIDSSKPNTSSLNSVIPFAVIKRFKP